MSEMPMSPYQPRPRHPFRWGPLAILALGIRFLLLAVSASFNVYFLVAPDIHLRRTAEAMLLEQMAMQQRVQAEKTAAELARQQETVAKRRVEEIAREMDLLRKQLDEAKRIQK